MAADFSSTSKILSNPASADPAMVVSNISDWQSSLSGLGSAGQSINADLEALKTALTAGTPDGAAIGKLMTKLGQATAQAGSGNAQLEQLGQQLSQIGK